MNITTSQSKPLQTAFILLALGFVAVLLLRIILVFSYIPETGGVSVNVLFSIVRMLNGYSLYTDPQLPPYPVVQYMPLHYFIVTGLGKLMSIQNNIHAVSVLNRLLCLAFDLLVFIPVYKILSNIFKVNSRQLIAAVCMCIFLILPNSNYARIDNLYLLLFITAIYQMLLFVSKPATDLRKLAITAFIISLAIFTKQSGLFLLAGTGLYLLIIHREWKATILFSLTVLICCTSLFFLLSQNNYYEFYQNTVLGLNNGISLSWFNTVIIKTFFYKMYFFVAAGLALAVLAFKKGTDKTIQLIGMVSMVVFICSLLASLKWGSATNYFTEFLALSFMLSAIHFTRNSITSSLTPIFLLCITPLFILSVFNDKGWGHLSGLKKSKQVYAETMQVSNYIQSKLNRNEYVFTDFHKENLLNIALNSNSLFPHREIVVHCSYPKKIFSYDDFNTRLQSGKLKYWIGKKDDEPSGFLNVHFNKFEKDTVIGGFAVYRLMP